ncbi:MAG: GNAT family protein [Patescibacteria group bacterium]
MAIIYSKKFILRPLKKGDEFSLTKNINDKIISRNTMTIRYPYKIKDARAWINQNLKSAKKKKKTKIVFVIDIGNEVVGSIGLHKIEGHCTELGYWLGKKYRGQGIMTEAAKLVTKYAFSELGLKRVYATVFLFNKPSARVLEKAGFKFEGKLIKNKKKGGKFLDSLLYAKVK